MTVAALGIARLVPIASIFALRTRIIWFLRFRAATTSIKFPARMTIAPGPLSAVVRRACGLLGISEPLDGCRRRRPGAAWLRERTFDRAFSPPPMKMLRRLAIRFWHLID